MAKTPEELKKELAMYEVQSLDTANALLGVQADILGVMIEQNKQLERGIGMKTKGGKLTKEEEEAINDAYESHKKYVGR